MRAYEEIAADLAHTDRHGVPWPGAARRILIDAAMMLDRLAAVDHLIAQARKVSPSPTMTVYVGDLEAALGRGVSPRGIVGQNDAGPAAAADAPQPKPPTGAGCPVCHVRTGCVHSDRLLAAIDALPDEPQERCPQGQTDYEACYAPFRYCPVRGCNRPSPGMTAEQFAQGYAERSGVTVKWLAERGRVPRPCDCGADDCDGWQMAHVEEPDPSPAQPADPPTKCDHGLTEPHDYHRPFSNGTRETIRCPGPSPADAPQPEDEE